MLLLNYNNESADSVNAAVSSRGVITCCRREFSLSRSAIKDESPW